MEPDFNPFASPLADEAVDPLVSGDAETDEATRRRLLNRETSIKSISLLFFLQAFFTGLIARSALVPLFEDGGATPVQLGSCVAIFACLICIASLQVWSGRSLRKFNRTARAPSICLSALMMVSFPVGTLLGVYCLFLLRGQKGKEVLSPEYQRVVAATPHIKYRTPIVNWILLLLVVLLALGVALALTASPR